MSELLNLVAALDAVNQDAEHLAAQLAQQAGRLSQATASAASATQGSGRPEGAHATDALRNAHRAVTQAAQLLHASAVAGKGFVARHAAGVGSSGAAARPSLLSPEFAPGANLEPPEPVSAAPMLARSLGALASRLVGGSQGTPLSGVPGVQAGVLGALARADVSLSRWDANDQALCARWMGDSSDATRARLQSIASRMRQRSTEIELVPFEHGHGGPDTFAYVYPNDPGHHVFVGDLFWGQHDSPPPMDSKAGVIIHEMSHFTDVGDTHDHIYGQDGAASLAEVFGSEESLDNADNVEYYFEGFLL
jgi:hypothetical protein